jgi:phosphoribosylanthranilate isomerase
MTFIKICGITNLQDALAAVDAGADMLGFNFYEPSPRYLTPSNARAIIDQLPASILAVGVFVNEPIEAVKSISGESGIAACQLHGDESPEYCRELSQDRFVIKTVAVSTGLDIELTKAYDVEAIMLDTRDPGLRGGTGRAFDWSVAQRAGQSVAKLFLAGGLSPENVEEAIATVRPYAVDACSALEDTPGQKNHERMRSFVRNARNVKP